MPAQRIKGQEVSIIIVQATQYQDTLTDIKDFSFEIQTELKMEGYLGEKTNRYDEVYNGVKFDFKMHTHTQDHFTLSQSVVQRAKRQTPDVVFNISGVFSYPNGQTPTILISDAHFGPIGHNITDRGAYVEDKITGGADDYFPTFT